MRSTVALRSELSLVEAPVTSMLAMDSAWSGVLESGTPAAASSAHCASCAALNSSHEARSCAFTSGVLRTTAEVRLSTAARCTGLTGRVALPSHPDAAEKAKTSISTCVRFAPKVALPTQRVV
eukprot:scaffold74194_cov66-Phaeocystis_antarctica.AAC.1